jgi:hypothetical protein
VLEYGTASVEVGSNTNVYVKNCQIDSWTGTPTFFSPRFSSVKLSDSNNTHHLTIDTTSDLTSNRSLHLVPGDSDRTITLSGNPTLDDWFNQAVKTTSTGVVFAGLAITNAATTHIDMNVGATGRAAQIHFNRGGAADCYVGPSAANVFDIWCVENISFQLAVNNAQQIEVTSTATHINGQLQVDHIGQHTGFHRTVIDNGLDIAAGQTLKADHIAELTGAHTVTFDNDITRVGKLSIDHIAEATGSHGIVLDNDLSRAGKISVDHIAETTGSHNIVLDNKLLVDHIGEATAGHKVIIDNGVYLSNYTGILNALSGQVNAIDYTNWTTPTYASGNYTGSDSMTWTVEAGDVVKFVYHIVGKMMTVLFTISSSAIGGTPSNILMITVPGGKSPVGTVANTIFMMENGTWKFGIAETYQDVYPNKILILKGDISNFTAGAFNVYGQLTFEIS